MKVKTLSLLAGAGSLLLAGTAMAQTAPSDFVGVEIHDFTGFFMDNHPNAQVRAAYAGAGLNTYRVYATFTGAAMVQAHGGKAVAGVSAWSNSSDGSFYNYIDAGYHGDTHYNFAPTGPQITANPSHAFDTFGTIGNFVNSAAQGYPGDAGLGAAIGNMQGNWAANDQGWFLNPDSGAQGVANQTQQGLENDGLYRVLLYQISVAAGAEVSGNVGVLGGISSAAGAGGGGFEIWDGEENGILYYSTVPAPGALALLGLAGLVGTRRRRA